MKDISKTTLTGVAMLLIVSACLAMLVLGKLTPAETAVALGLLLNQTISAFGHVAAQDAGNPVAVETTSGRVEQVVSAEPKTTGEN